MVQKIVKANDISINIEDRGPETGKPLLLVNGYTSTMLSWPEELMDGLAARGFRIIRYDNRDVGKSEKFTGLPSLSDVVAALRAGRTPDIPYTLADMAADGVGVLDALGIARAHVLGVSMGGMIVQRMAIHHPERLFSVTSIMSSTGNPALPKATPEAMEALQARPASEDREDIIRHRMAGRRVYQSPAYPRSDEDLYAACAREYDHMYYPDGGVRQYAAIVGDGSRVDALRDVRVPFLVIHGKADPLVPHEGGEDTAASVPGARLVSIEGMGHDLPVELCPQYIDLVAEHALAAEG